MQDIYTFLSVTIIKTNNLHVSYVRVNMKIYIYVIKTYKAIIFETTMDYHNLINIDNVLTIADCTPKGNMKLRIAEINHLHPFHWFNYIEQACFEI